MTTFLLLGCGRKGLVVGPRDPQKVASDAPAGTSPAETTNVNLTPPPGGPPNGGPAAGTTNQGGGTAAIVVAIVGPPKIDLFIPETQGKSPVVVGPNAEVTLQWTAQDAAACVLSGHGLVSPTGGSVNLPGSLIDRNFTLTCTNSVGTSMDSQAIEVEANVPGQRTNAFFTYYDSISIGNDVTFHGQGIFKVEPAMKTIFALKTHAAMLHFSNSGCLNSLKLQILGRSGMREIQVQDPPTRPTLTVNLEAGDELRLETTFIGGTGPLSKQCGLPEIFSMTREVRLIPR